MTPRDDVATLVRDLLGGKKFEGVLFVDRFLALAAAVGEVRCAPAGDDRLRFTITDEPPFEVELDRARGTLRWICARLAVLCAGEALPALYGGEGRIALGMNSESRDGAKSANRIVLNVHFANRPGDVEFTLWGEERRPAGLSRESEQLHA